MKQLAFVCLLTIVTITIQRGETEIDQFKARTNYCPQWSRDGSRIVFYSQIRERWRIISMNADGSKMRMLSSGDHNDYYPSWSPKEEKILFYSNREKNEEIFSMNPDGENVVRLTNDLAKDRYPRWSPDGKSIAFVSGNTPETAEIKIMRSDGTGVIRITQASQINVISRLSWSPSSSEIIFYSSNDGKDMSDKNQWALFSVTISGGTPVRIGEWRRDANAHWSGLASLIVFDAHKNASWESEDGGWEIFSMKPDGSDRRNLTNNEKRNDWGASWSPDGKKIAYSSGIDDRYEIYVMNSDGSNVKRLTFNVWN